MRWPPLALASLAVLAAACSYPQAETARDAGASAPPAPTIDLEADEVRVLLVSPGGPAERAGFLSGDRLLAGDGEELACEADADRALARAAEGRPVFFEVKRGRQVLTLPLSAPVAGWHLLAGGTLRGVLLGRSQGGPAPAPKVHPRARAPLELSLASLDGRPFTLRERRGAPLALLFWGTFSPDSDQALRDFEQACAVLSERGLTCLAVDTLDLFTAAGRSQAWAADVLRVRREVFPRGELAIDLPMRAARAPGVQTLPTLVLVDPRGLEVGRWATPLPDLARELGLRLEDPRARP
jgi:hypothetical protein